MPKLPLHRHPYLYCKRKFRRFRAKHARQLQGRQIKLVKDVKILLDLDITRHMNNIYYDAYEIEVVHAIKKYLKPGGIFFDIGANMGYLSAVALAQVGRSGQVHSFEPVPRYCELIREIARLNPDYRLIVNQFALGDQSGQTAIFTHQDNVGGSSLLADYIPEQSRSDSLTIQIKKLDEYCRENDVEHIDLIKIDTEGYELPVLEGAVEFLKSHDRPPIIMEITPSALESIDKNIQDVMKLLADLGYEVYCAVGTHRISWEEIAGVRQTDIVLKPIR